MSSHDRFNRMTAAMGVLVDEGLRPVLAVRFEGRVHEFRMNPGTHHLTCDTSDVHPRVMLEDPFTRFVEGYPGAKIDADLSAVW